MGMVGQVESRKARKTHKCSWCDDPIEHSEEYVRWLWKDGADMVPVKCHLDCYDAWQRDGAEFANPSEARRGMTFDEAYDYNLTHPVCEGCGREFHAPDVKWPGLPPELCPECLEKESAPREQ